MIKYELKEIATVSNKSGLFKVLKPTRSGVIIESLNSEKKRMMIQTRHKISLLHEISIFTTDADGSIPLEKVFVSIHELYKKSLPVTDTSEESKLRNFMETVLPSYDRERVYLSDIKKLVSWYTAVNEFNPPKEEKSEKKETKKESVKEGTKETAKKTKAASETTEKEDSSKKKTPAKKTTPKK